MTSTHSHLWGEIARGAPQLISGSGDPLSVWSTWRIWGSTETLYVRLDHRVECRNRLNQTSCPLHLVVSPQVIYMNVKLAHVDSDGVTTRHTNQVIPPLHRSPGIGVRIRSLGSQPLLQLLSQVRFDDGLRTLELLGYQASDRVEQRILDMQDVPRVCRGPLRIRHATFRSTVESRPSTRPA